MSHVDKHGSSGKRKALSVELHWIILLAVPFSLSSSRVAAQIIPDNTLPNNSIVAPNGNSLTINGGTTASGNLFHSFREFSVPIGSEAFFNNGSNIQNIFSRVTGGKISNIDGLIRANGSANLFLINPSGIIFGSNARLNIGGSFFASTANNLLFSDGNSFSAINPEASPLLTVNIPIGLQFGQNPGAIRVEGMGHGFTAENPIFAPINRGESTSGLRVKPGKTIALVGGDIKLSGGLLTAEEGRIELGGVGVGQVSLRSTNSSWILGYEKVQDFQDISLSQQAAVDTSGHGSGSIQIVGRQVRLTDGSIALIQNQGEQSSGILNVNASELLELRGTTPDVIIRSGLQTETVGRGNAGDIVVFTRPLLIQDGAWIESRVFGAGAGGNLSINASDAEVRGFSPANSNVFSFIGTLTLGSGNSGNITLSARQLSLQNGGQLSAPTLGSGKGGNLTLNVSEFVTVRGIISEILQPSAIGSSTSNAGDVGNIIINTSRLVVGEGGVITTSTLAQGSAGNLTINASDAVEVSGIGAGGGLPSRIESAATIETEAFRQRLGLPNRPSGNSGSVIINTPRLTISDGARVSVANQGTGIAGDLNINARQILLNNQGSLTASTASGTGGNIQLQVSGDTILRNGSQIAAEAAGIGNGGNLTANTNTLTILEGSKVTANAFQGNGGNIRIATQGLFTSLNSRITASSSFGVSGSISINNPNLEPSSGLVPLPQNVVDPSTQIAQGCAADGGNTFTIAGKGGLSEEPNATLRGQTVWQDLQNYAVESPQSHNEPSKTPPVTTIPETPSLVEAVGWQINAKGEVELVANLPAGAEVTASDRASNNNCPRQKVEPN